MDVIIPDVKPEIEEISDREAAAAAEENNIGGDTGKGSGGTGSNNNILKTLTPQLAKTLQQQSQSSGGTVYLNNTNNSAASSVRTSTILTTASSTVVTQQQLQNMGKSSGLNIVHVTLPQSVIQSPSSVIQSASGQIQLSKGNLILVAKPQAGVIQTTGGALQAVQLLEAQQQHLNSEDESLSNDGVETSPSRSSGGGGGARKRREILTRRPSYRKILNDLGGAEITGERGDSSDTSDSSQDGLGGNANILIGGQQYPQSVVKVINANTLGLGGGNTAENATSLQTITMTNAGTGGTIVQYAHPDGQPFYVPGNHWTGSMVGGDVQTYTIRPMSSANTNSNNTVLVQGSGGHSHHHPPEEQTRKREIRLLKNREAARECRRKKKEYIKCLENRVAVLENQNKALIDELKSLKELYCQQKIE